MNTIEITDAMRLEVDMYCDRDTDVRCQTLAIVTVRKEHHCPTCEKPIPIGARAYKETALVDEQWCSAWTCLPCVDKWVRVIRGESGEEVFA